MDHVNQKTTRSTKSTTAGVGRPIEFNHSVVIGRAVDLFWTKGFDDTTLDDLVAELGISRSTLYNSFDGKEGLYAAALDRYLDHLEEVVVHPLKNGAAGIDDLLAFVDRLDQILTSHDMPAGCLVLNWIASPRNSPAVTRYLSALRQAIDASLTRAAALGEIDQSTIAPRTALVLAATIGANHAAQASASNLDVADLINGLRATAHEWSNW